MQEFMRLFNFRPDGTLLVGIERECFIVDGKGEIVPRATEMLGHLSDRSRFGYELSACQLEDRVGPIEVSRIKERLLENERDILAVEKKLGCGRLHLEVAPESLPLDVYPDPTGRYQIITKDMPRHILTAACRVTGTHVHIGMPDHETALRVYNDVVGKTDELCRLGDGSGGERLRIYSIMAPDFQPPRYESWSEFYKVAISKGFASDPRKCWNLIRLSVHGTIEFRMFGATPNFDKIVEWGEICHKLCQEAMR